MWSTTPDAVAFICQCVLRALAIAEAAHNRETGRVEVDGPAISREEFHRPRQPATRSTLLHGIYEHAIRRGGSQSNPVKQAESPTRRSRTLDIRFLDGAELEALLRPTPDTPLGQVEHVMYLAAATIGMRQGELIGLRWIDVDWPARRIRVRQSYIRGEFGTPKSKRSSRAVPLIDRLAGDLDRLYQQTAFQADEDLVFAHPHTGNPLDRSKLLKRFKDALKRAGVRDVRFHDLRHTFGTAWQRRASRCARCRS